jgi:hypothetical protein
MVCMEAGVRSGRGGRRRANMLGWVGDGSYLGEEERSKIGLCDCFFKGRMRTDSNVRRRATVRDNAV